MRSAKVFLRGCGEASCWILCELHFVTGGGLFSHWLDEEDEKNLGAAIDKLGDDFRTITPADALAAVIKREETSSFAADCKPFWGSSTRRPGAADSLPKKKGGSPSATS